MINRQALLADLQKLLQRIEADLLERSESTEVPEVPAALHAEYEKAAKAERTAQNYEDWRTDTITQAAAAWVLSCVFVRFLEDNSLIDPPKIAGPGERLARARDEHELYFRSHPQHTDREYLLSIFTELAKLPGTKDIFGEHNAINDLPNWLSGDAAGELLNFFQKVDASTGDLVHEFTDPNWDTRFLGDLYQDLSEAARKKFALLQTPDFVEEFILDRTLEPALEDFGLVPTPLSSEPETQCLFRMIDPACGSGHFLLGSFTRILNRWLKKEPGTKIRELVQRTLNSIHGVDVNPFAIGIARFRLLLSAIKACDIERLVDAPSFSLNLACGDSLYHGRQFQLMLDGIETDESHYFATEDKQSLTRILREGTFHAVVANPPYITPKDKAAREAYKSLYSTCYMKYSLSIPFMERIFRLAIRDEQRPGYTGQITSNSFMKREFGKKLIESFLKTVNLEFIIDTSGAYLPGHGTPTVILFGRNRNPTATTVRLAMGIRGEPCVPEVARDGVVWNAILNQIDTPNSDSDFVTVTDADRIKFTTHPWSIGGGGASELKDTLDEVASSVLKKHASSIGYASFPGLDEAFVSTELALKRQRIPRSMIKIYIDGESVSDWHLTPAHATLTPYDGDFSLIQLSTEEDWARYLWPLRTSLGAVKSFGGKTRSQLGHSWWGWYRWIETKYRDKLGITFGNVASRNQFVLDRGGHTFNGHAPLIKLKNASEDDFVGLLGLLNSSTACFWMKQVAFPKGGDQVGGSGARIRRTWWDERYDFDGTKLLAFPVIDEKPTKLVHKIETCSSQLGVSRLKKKLQSAVDSSVADLVRVETTYQASNLARLIGLQEDLDWQCYRLYGLLDEDLAYSSESPEIHLGERAFEIVMARKISQGQLATTWFERHSSKPITELPSHWTEGYKTLVNRRIEVIESNASIGLIEQPEYKRRWNIEPWKSQLNLALYEWLSAQLESYVDFDRRITIEPDVEFAGKTQVVPLSEVSVYSIAQLADVARRDLRFMEVGEVYRGDAAFDVQSLVEEIVLAESVPHLPILRYKEPGLRKRAEWEKSWDLQRREDAGEAIGAITTPPKYSSADFISTGGARYWALRGNLDVPKESWISFPHCEGPDGTLVICWAGYDHLQQAQAISAYYVRVQTEFGGSDDPRLIPLLASLIELLPWLKQWHNEPNANFDGLRMGDYFDGFVNEEARNLGKTLAEIKAWVPPAKGQRGRVAKGQSGRKVAKAKRGKGSKVQSDEGADE